MKLHSTALGVAILLAQAGAQAAVTFDITDLSLGQATGGQASIATGIDNQGRILGKLIGGSGAQTNGWLLGAGSTSRSDLAGALSDCMDQPDWPRHAFVTPFIGSRTTGMVAINGRVDTAGGSKPDMGLVTAICDNGQTVGQDTSGHAILLTPRGMSNGRPGDYPGMAGLLALRRLRGA